MKTYVLWISPCGMMQSYDLFVTKTMRRDEYFTSDYKKGVMASILI